MVAGMGWTMRPEVRVRYVANFRFWPTPGPRMVPRPRTDDRFALAFVWVYPWCWQLESHSLASALVVFLFDNPGVSLFFLSFALTFLLCACALGG